MYVSGTRQLNNMLLAVRHNDAWAAWSGVAADSERLRAREISWSKVAFYFGASCLLDGHADSALGWDLGLCAAQRVRPRLRLQT